MLTLPDGRQAAFEVTALAADAAGPRRLRLALPGPMVVDHPSRLAAESAALARLLHPHRAPVRGRGRHLGLSSCGAATRMSTPTSCGLSWSPPPTCGATQKKEAASSAGRGDTPVACSGTGPPSVAVDPTRLGNSTPTMGEREQRGRRAPESRTVSGASRLVARRTRPSPKRIVHGSPWLVGAMAACCAVEELPKDVHVFGVAGSLLDHADQHRRNDTDSLYHAGPRASRFSSSTTFSEAARARL